MAGRETEPDGASAKADKLTFIGTLAFAVRLWQFWVALTVGTAAIQLIAFLMPSSWQPFWQAAILPLLGGILGGEIRTRYYRDRQNAEHVGDTAPSVGTADCS